MSIHSSSSPPLRLRFVRLNPRFDRDETLGLLKSEIQKHNANADDDTKECCALPVPWLNSKQHQLEFFAIPGEFSLNRSTSFQSGRVYGMDVTSGAAVAALLFDLCNDDNSGKSVSSDERTQRMERNFNSEEPLRVLDLCCAPGLKLCMMADLAPRSSILVGVDISSQRISLCKNIVQKYHIDETSSTSMSKSNGGNNSSADNSNISSSVTIRLHCTDGTTFGMNKSKPTDNYEGLVFDSNAAVEEFKSRGKRKRMNKSARAREKRRLLEVQRRGDDANATTNNANLLVDSNHPLKEESTLKSIKKRDSNEATLDNCDEGGAISLLSFDRVLVDAECSTDGAIRHIEKRQSSSTKPRSPAWNDTNMDELVALQKRLIESGFRLLKRGGIMVYSTCSLSSKQNEQVVRWLLDKHKDAFIIPVSFSTHQSPQKLSFIEEGSISGTVRFNPMNEMTVGQDQLDCIIPGTGFFLAKIGKRTTSLVPYQLN